MGWMVVAAVASGLTVWFAWAPPPLARLGPPGKRWDRQRVVAVWAVVRGRLPAGRAARARTAALVASLPGVCELLAVSLEAGAPPRATLALVAEACGGAVGEELDRVSRRIALGVDERQAWESLGEVPGYRGVARDLSRAVGHGTGLADLLRRHASDARANAAAAAQARARTASVHSVVPLMVCFLPAFLLLGVVPMLVSVIGGMVA